MKLICDIRDERNKIKNWDYFQFPKKTLSLFKKFIKPVSAKIIVTIKL